MFSTLPARTLLRRAGALAALFLSMPLFIGLSVLLRLETGRLPIEKENRSGLLRFQTRDRTNRRGPWGRAVSRSGLHRLPVLLNQIGGTKGQRLARSLQARYRKAV